MRENDDAAPGSGDGSLAEGLGETVEPGRAATDPFGDGGFEDTYGDGGAFGEGEVPGDAPDHTPVDDLPTRDASPLEGLGYLIEQVREALFGADEGATAGPGTDPLASAIEAGAPDPAEPADLVTDSDLDLTGDGVVDDYDLVEAEHPFDFGA
ncbi:MAG TPA: hypothetical protein VFZ77_11395 [Acidimicrobiales bacterium]